MLTKKCRYVFKKQKMEFQSEQGDKGNFPEQVTILGHLKDIIGIGKMGQEERKGSRANGKQWHGN